MCTDGGWARGHDEKMRNVEYGSINRISYVPAIEVLSVCGHLIHGVYVRSKVRAE